MFNYFLLNKRSNNVQLKIAKSQKTRHSSAEYTNSSNAKPNQAQPTVLERMLLLSSAIRKFHGSLLVHVLRLFQECVMPLGFRLGLQRGYMHCCCGREMKLIAHADDIIGEIFIYSLVFMYLALMCSSWRCE
jgi:hypothetical protein